MKYKSGQLFWGFLFITFGILFLLDKNDYLFSIPENITDYWPVLIILWGIAIIAKESILKPIIAMATGVFIGIFIYGSIFGFNSPFPEQTEIEKEISTATFYEDYNDSIKYATLSLRTGVGQIKLSGVTNKLISGTSSGIYNSFNFKTRYRNNNARIILRHIQNNIEVFGKNRSRNLEFSLNPNPIWKINLKVGAANVNMNLSEYKVAEFNLETGATTTKLMFGEKLDSVKINIKMGAATLKIKIPQESACQVKGDMVMVMKNLEGFTKVSKKRYRTDNFDSAQNKIFINIDGGVSTFKVERY